MHGMKDTTTPHLRGGQPLAEGDPHDGVRGDEHLVHLAVEPRRVRSAKVRDDGNERQLAPARPSTKGRRTYAGGGTVGEGRGEAW